MKITKSQLKQIIKEELEEMQRYDPSQELSAQGLSRDETLYYEPAEEVTHEEVIEKVQGLPQGVLAQIWEFIKAAATGDPSGIMSAEELADFRAKQAKSAAKRLSKYSDPSFKYGSDTYEESKKKKTKK